MHHGVLFSFYMTTVKRRFGKMFVTMIILLGIAFLQLIDALLADQAKCDRTITVPLYFGAALCVASALAFSFSF